MNAVKRCLALIAATLVVGACGGDPTADAAGKDLTIRATPGAVWMRQDKTASVIIEAIDGLGGTQPGSWTATVDSGSFTVALDTAFQSTSSGPLGNQRQFVITATGEGEGAVTFSGTGGSALVPVRIAPDPVNFHTTVSNANPAIAETLTVTAPAGIRFTATTVSTGINFVTGPTNTVQNGLAAPALLSMSTDSTSFKLLPAPGANGHLRIAGIASISTPSLISTANTDDSVKVPALTSVAATFTPSAAPALNAQLTITMPVNFKFRPTSAMTQTGHTFAPILVSRAADSNSVVIIPSPGAATPISITAVRFAPLGGLSLSLPTSGNVTVGALADAGPDDPLNSATFAAPTVSGTSTGWYDIYTMSQPDPSPGCDGAVGAQFYTLTVSVTGSYTLSMNWSNGSDFDFGIMVKDGSYGGSGGGAAACSDYISTAGLASSKPETITTTLTAGVTYVINAMDFAGNGSGSLQMTVKKN